MSDTIRDSKVDLESVRDKDMHGRRVVNASDSKDKQDYVTRNELNNLAKVLVSNPSDILSTIVEMFTQATLPSAKNFKNGTMIWISDFNHILMSVKGSWVRITPNMFVQGFLVAPDPIAGWQLCNGAAGVKYMLSDGTLSGTITVPNQPFFANFGNAYNGPGITAAAVPTSSTPAFTGTPGTTGSGAANIQAASALFTINTVNTGLFGVTANTHVHSDSGHTHSNTPAGTVSAPTISLPGNPVPNITFLAYIRL